MRFCARCGRKAADLVEGEDGLYYCIKVSACEARVGKPRRGRTPDDMRSGRIKQAKQWAKRLSAATELKAVKRTEAEAADQALRLLIRRALAEGHPMVTVAAWANLSRARIEQIRDDRRT